MEAMPVAILCGDHAKRRRRLPVEEGSLENQEWLPIEDVAAMLRRRESDGWVGGESENEFLSKLSRKYGK